MTDDWSTDAKSNLVTSVKNCGHKVCKKWTAAVKIFSKGFLIFAPKRILSGLYMKSSSSFLRDSKRAVPAGQKLPTIFDFPLPLFFLFAFCLASYRY